MSRLRLILLAHGSRDADWRKSFEVFRDDLARELDKDSVDLAYLELAPPTLEEAVTKAAGEGIEQIRVLPLFMAMGKHLDRDLPKQIQKIAAGFPKVKIELLPAIASDSTVYNAMKAAARKAASG